MSQFFSFRVEKYGIESFSRTDPTDRTAGDARLVADRRHRPTGAGRLLTRVVKECGDEGAVLEEGVAGGDVLEVALLEERVLEHHGAHFQVHESANGNSSTCVSAGRRTCVVLHVKLVI